MQNVVDFWASFFPIISDFLMSDPIIYFVALLLLIFVVSFLNKLLHY